MGDDAEYYMEQLEEEARERKAHDDQRQQADLKRDRTIENRAKKKGSSSKPKEA